MSTLGDLENQIVTRLAGGLLLGDPIFRSVKGVSGGFRPALRDALRREPMPAAFVAFVDEPSAPETQAEKRGARFSLMLAARMLRPGANPRLEEIDSIGALEVIDQVRILMDFYAPPSGTIQFQRLQDRFLDADDRVVIYELLYRAWPALVAAFTFAGDDLVGAASSMMIEAQAIELSFAEFRFPGLAGAYRHNLGTRARTIVAGGRLVADDDAAMDALEADFQQRIATGQMGDIQVAGGANYTDCVLDRYERIGPRRLDADGSSVVQPARLIFMQPAPE
jgi:hypothetical protein